MSLASVLFYNKLRVGVRGIGGGGVAPAAAMLAMFLVFVSQAVTCPCVSCAPRKIFFVPPTIRRYFIEKTIPRYHRHPQKRGIVGTEAMKVPTVLGSIEYRDKPNALYVTD